MPQKSLTIALAGNPNSGKTTIFNNITGTRQKVGNWPGVTVAKKEGRISKHGRHIRIIDLPGTYSLTPLSIEEIIARNFVLEEHPDVVIDIIDASNLERSLYLATQLREIDCKVLFALNMADVAQDRGIKIDAEKLSELLNVPVVFTVGVKNEGIDTLLEKAVDLADLESESPQRRKVKYSQDIETAIAEMETLLLKTADAPLPYESRWTAVKLLEDDKIVKQRISQFAPDEGRKILKKNLALRKHLADRFDED
ncbi:MAG: FeoB small GTPase domain-containing protein, partial [Desulfobacterales bacterium]